MSRRRRQLGVRNPDVLLLLPLLARAHCHARIVETKAVDRSIYFVQVSRLSPQAARQHPSGGTDFRGVNLLCTKTGEDDYVPHFQQRRAGSSANLDSNDPRYLPASAVLAMLFFELRAADRNDIEALNLVRRIQLRRPFYGAVILRGESLHPDDTAIVQQYQSNEPVPAEWTEAGLLHGCGSDSVESSGRRVRAM